MINKTSSKKLLANEQDYKNILPDLKSIITNTLFSKNSISFRVSDYPL